ncbi:hypothetical protein EXE43_09600 [Halorubrum sp. SS5]|nr:hypothetical protein EXE43_09600 [Halorubrum sp. SS5]
MTALVDWVVMVTSTITALGVLGLLRAARGIWHQLQDLDRAVYGTENTGWEGLMPKVKRLEEAAEEEDLL